MVFTCRRFVVAGGLWVDVTYSMTRVTKSPHKGNDFDPKGLKTVTIFFDDHGVRHDNPQVDEAVDYGNEEVKEEEKEKERVKD